MTNPILADKPAPSLRMSSIDQRHRPRDADYIYVLPLPFTRRSLRRSYRRLRAAGIDKTRARWLVIDLVGVGADSEGHLIRTTEQVTP